MQNSLRQKFSLAFIFFIGLQFSEFNSYGQHYEKQPEPELAWGIKVVTREIIYGKNKLYVTDPAGIGLQTSVRYDAPVKISFDRYIDLVGQAGFLFCKAKAFDTTFFDPGANIYHHQKSYNATYMPLYFGAYNMSAFSLGAEVFYWKGLGTRDIWGVKFISLGYNGRQFRLNAAGELYAQVKNGKHNGMLFSVDFLWKLISADYRKN